MNRSSARRGARLEALGVMPYRLRARDARAAPAEPPPESARPGGGAMPESVACVVLLPSGCASRELDRAGRALRAFGEDFARAPRVQVPVGGLREAPPSARAYLVFGEPQARALGQVLSAAAMREAEVVLLDAPGQLGQGASKQRLWLAMKALRRRLGMH